MVDTIIVMGPGRVGKSTVGKHLAEHLGRPFTTLSDTPRDYFVEAGFEEAEGRRAWEERGFEGWYHVIKPYQPHALRRGLVEHRGAVVELGALLPVQDDPALYRQVAELLAPHTTVVLLPSPDIEESVRVLESRQRILYKGTDLNEYFVRHPANQRLAKLRTYTAGKTPAETCAEVLARIDPAHPEVILIGPMGTGKSTIGRMLAQRLGRPQVSMDQHRWRYYQEAGFEQAEMDRLHNEEGPTGVIRYWKHFDVNAVQRLLEENRASVMDFGAGHSVYDDDADLLRVQELLAPYPNVVLLLPSPDPEESLRILAERNTPRIAGTELNRYLITHPAYRELARIVVYTEDKTPLETRDEILSRISSGPGETPEHKTPASGGGA